MPLASRVAWVVASLYGVRLVLIGAVKGGSGEVVATVGVLMIGLALAVKRGERSATWLLDVLWMAPVVLFLRAEAPLEAAIPLVLASTSVWAGFALRRRVPSVTTAEQWIRVLPVFAFLQAGWELLLFARAVVLGEQLARPHLIQGVIEGGLGAAASKRRTWGAYGLTLGAIINLLIVVQNRAVEEAATRSAILSSTASGPTISGGPRYGGGHGADQS
jgi:hypothetical protein